MSNLQGAGLPQLVQEIKLASENIRKADDANREKIEESINELYRRTGRPGGFMTADDDAEERKSAIGLCQIRKSLTAEGDASAANYLPGSAEIQTAMLARQGLKALFRTGDVNHIEPEYRKALSSFSFGNNGFLLAPEMSSRVLSCLVDPTDVSGLVDSITISSPSVCFLIDNARMMEAAWACEASCYSTNAQPDLNEGPRHFGDKARKPTFYRLRDQRPVAGRQLQRRELVV